MAGRLFCACLARRPAPQILNSRNLQARLILVSLKLGFFRLGILLAVSGKDSHAATLSVYGVTPLRVFDPGFHFVWSGRKSAALFDAKSSIVRRSAAAGERVFVSVAPRLCYSVAQTLRGVLMAICKLYGGVIGLVKSVLVDYFPFVRGFVTFLVGKSHSWKWWTEKRKDRGGPSESRALRSFCPSQIER